MKRMLSSIHSRFILFTAMLMLLLSSVAFAQQSILLEINHSTMFDAGGTVARLAVANPEIADVMVLDGDNINLIGKQPGSTSLVVWTTNGMRQDFTVIVEPVDSGSADAIKAKLDLPFVEVERIGSKVLLTGFVNDQIELDLAVSVAKMYVADPADVICRIQMLKPLQINLAAMVLDVNASDAEAIGIQYGNAEKVPNNNSTDGNYGTNDIVFGDAGVFYGGQNWDRATGRVFAGVDAMVQAMVSNGTGRVLSRPNVTTMSGNEAQILVGGEIPVPTSKDGEISVTWKEYGIKLRILPTADTEGKITTSIEAEVSSIDPANSVPTTAGMIPALTSRKVTTVVNIKDGNTMAIGGLLDNIDSKTIKKIPILGDIPVLGQFFKHTASSKKRRELIILITPTVVSDTSRVSVGDRLRDEIEASKRRMAEMNSVDLNAAPAPGAVNAKNM